MEIITIIQMSNTKYLHIVRKYCTVEPSRSD